MGCKTKSGPCDYETTRSIAEIEGITPIEKNGKKLFKIRLQFAKTGLYSTPQYLEELLEIEIDSNFLVRNRIWVGNQYLTNVSERIDEGNCKKTIVSFENRFR